MNDRLRLRDEYRRGTIDKHEYSHAMTAQHSALQEYVALLAESDIEKIELTSDGVWLHSRLAPVAFACDVSDRGTPPMVSLHFGQYERAEFDMWRRLVPRAAMIADVGANIGWYCAHMGAIDSTARIIAFEPVPSTFHWLSKTIARNNLTNVIAERLAISNHPGSFDIYVDPSIAGAASAHPTVYVANSSPISVKATTLDEYATIHELRFDAIKLDVEGAELSALQGAKRVLTEHHPIIFSEMLRRHARAFGYHPNDILALMRGMNYCCFRVAGDRLVPFEIMEEDTVETNFFFLHHEAHASRLDAIVT
jgi:FkbM family methyltransferase